MTKSSCLFVPRSIDQGSLDVGGTRRDGGDRGGRSQWQYGLLNARRCGNLGLWNVDVNNQTTSGSTVGNENLSQVARSRVRQQLIIYFNELGALSQVSQVSQAFCGEVSGGAVLHVVLAS